LSDADAEQQNRRGETSTKSTGRTLTQHVPRDTALLIPTAFVISEHQSARIVMRAKHSGKLRRGRLQTSSAVRRKFPTRRSVFAPSPGATSHHPRILSSCHWTMPPAA